MPFDHLLAVIGYPTLAFKKSAESEIPLPGTKHLVVISCDIVVMLKIQDSDDLKRMNFRDSGINIHLKFKL